MNIIPKAALSEGEIWQLKFRIGVGERWADIIRVLSCAGFRPAFVTGWRGKPIGQSRRNGAGGGECLLATRRFDAIESRSDCRYSPAFVVARSAKKILGTDPEKAPLHGSTAASREIRELRDIVFGMRREMK